MWFKNLVLFQLDKDVDLSRKVLEEGLEQGRFKPCGPQQPESIGWVAPMGPLSDQLYHHASGMTLLSARREERLLPATVIREALDEKVIEIEQREDRRIGRKQRLEIRDQLVFDMMPRAFTRSNLIQGLILPKLRLLVIDSASRNRAEQWTSLLRVSLGSLPLRPLKFNSALSNRFTGWLDGSVNRPAQVVPGDECVLQSADDEGSVVRCRRQDLEGKEIEAHLRAGKRATQIAIEWNQSLSFVITDEAEIKRLRFSDTLVEQDEVDGVDDPAAEFDARFNLLGLELSRFLPALIDALGELEE